jgi:hypothetical protein
MPPSVAAGSGRRLPKAAGEVAGAAYREGMTVPPDGTQPPYQPQPEPQPQQPEPQPQQQQYQPQPGYQPPPGYPAPGYPGYPVQPPPPKKSHTLRTVLIIIGVLLVLCCGGLAVGGVWLFSTAKNTIGPARDQANEFVQDLESQNATAAYDKLCTATRERFTQQDLIRVMAADPRIVSHKVTGFNVNKTNGVSTADITMELTDNAGATGKHTFHMVKENGTWYVCGNPY